MLSPSNGALLRDLARRRQTLPITIDGMEAAMKTTVTHDTGPIARFLNYATGAAAALAVTAAPVA
jgi:hypothetical protein